MTRKRKDAPLPEADRCADCPHNPFAGLGTDLADLVAETAELRRLLELAGDVDLSHLPPAPDLDALLVHHFRKPGGCELFYRDAQ
jgi:hypothetical protein